MLFAPAAMLVITALLSRELFSPVESGGFWPLLFFALPLLMALAIPPKALDSASGTTGTVQLISNAAAVGNAASQASSSAPASEASSGAAGSAQALPQIGLQTPDIALQDGVLVLTSENFYTGLCAVYDHFGDY